MQCRKCGNVITKHKFCSTECRKSWYFNEYRSVKGIDVGRGSGALCGKKNSNYKNGRGIVINGYNRLMKRSIRYCENCRLDLKYATHYQWCVHHRDHDNTNNELKNLQLLCKACHQSHHEVWKNFQGATTIREE